jgi:hypothetical protein
MVAPPTCPMRRRHIAKTPIALTSCAPKSNSESDRTAVSSFQESAGPRQVQFPNQHMTALQTALFKSGCFLTLFFVAGFSLTACQAKPQEEVAQPVVMPTPTGMIDEPTKALPADVFKGMPIYPGSVVTHVHKPKGAMREVMFEVKSPPPFATMVNYYKDGLKAGDFKITSSLMMPARKTWSCDFHKDGRPASVMIYPSDDDKSAATVDLIYEMASNIDPNLLEPKEDFDVIGPGPPGGVMPVAETVSKTVSNSSTQEKSKSKKKAKRK